MLCAFEGPPRIVRLHGGGEVLPAADPAVDGHRSVIRVDVEWTADSCGYGVRDYVAEKNAASIDGLPAFD